MRTQRQYLGWQCHNQTVEDSDSDKINIDNIAIPCLKFDSIWVYDYKEMKEINKAINIVLPTIEMDGTQKEGTFAQKMYLHLIRTIDALMRYAGFAHFEPLQIYVGIGLPDCLEKCYHLMNESKANAEKPQNFAMSKEMDQVKPVLAKPQRLCIDAPCAWKMGLRKQPTRRKQQTTRISNSNNGGVGECWLKNRENKRL